MIEGRTFTKHFHIETRQHEVFNLDLGEGVPRRMLVFGIVVVLAWVALLAPIVRVPTAQTFSFYGIPPVLFAYFAFQESAAQPRRKNITTWAIKVRYITVGHRPLIRLGARAAYRSEYLPASERIPFEAALRRIAPWALAPAWERDQPGADGLAIRAGSPISLDQSWTFYGFDHMEQLRARSKGKNT